VDRRLGKAGIIRRMKAGSKYHPLFNALQKSGEDEVILAIEEIETLVGTTLPSGARTDRAWWSNRSSASVQSSSWMSAGYHVTDINLETGQITFSKPIFKYIIHREGDTVLWNAEMIKALRHHMNASQGELAEELGVRQQTISEWETKIYAPKKAMSKLLGYVAERAGFNYET
jgi:DNA-binding XRE family transcriptional regulator